MRRGFYESQKGSLTARWKRCLNVCRSRHELLVSRALLNQEVIADDVLQVDGPKLDNMPRSTLFTLVLEPKLEVGAGMALNDHVRVSHGDWIL